MSFGFGFGMGAYHVVFHEQYRCYPMSLAAGKEDKERGDKIILPSSAFEKLAQMEVTYPLQFELTNNYVSPPTRTHVGVLEFTAPEGRCYVPYWIINNLQFSTDNSANSTESFGLISVRNVTLPLANFIRFKPMNVDFLDISNPKAVLESTLRNFSCMTKDDEICLYYNGKNYYLQVKDLKPQDACSIVEADVKVEFDAPEGYIDPNINNQGKGNSNNGLSNVGNHTNGNGSLDNINSENNLILSEEDKKLRNRKLLEEARKKREEELKMKTASYVPFAGKGQRVDGKVKGSTTEPVKTNGSESIQNDNLSADEVRKARAKQFSKRGVDKKFSGSGYSLG